MKSNLVSVIIPYYKKKKFISKSINSVLQQSHKYLEIYLIFDADSNADLNFIQQIVKKDKRIKLIINKKNIGAGLSRNKGIKKSKGNYIAFIDSDDLWHKDKIKLQLKFMKENDVKFCHSSYIVIDEKNRTIAKRNARNFETIDSLIFSCDIGLSTVMIKKEILKNELFPKLKTKEDFVLWLKLLKKGNKILGLKKNLASWRKNKNSLSSNTIQKLVDGFRVYHYFLKLNFIKSLYYLFILSINYFRKNI